MIATCFPGMLIGAGQMENAEQEVLHVTRRIFDAISRLDLVRLEAMLSDDYHYTSWRGEVMTKEERLTTLRSLIAKQDAERFTLSELRVPLVRGDIAVVVGRAHQTGRYEGQPYHLNQYRLHNSGLRYGDLIDEWIAEEKRRKSPGYKAPIASHGEYNRHIRDFFADPPNKGRTLRDAGMRHSTTTTASREMAPAGLWTTPSDLARWLLALDELLAPETLNAMFTEAMEKTRLGLGIGVSGTGNDLEVSHSGSNKGFRAMFRYYPARRQGVVIMTNSDNGASVAAPVVLALTKEYGWPGIKANTIVPVDVAPPTARRPS